MAAALGLAEAAAASREAARARPAPAPPRGHWPGASGLPPEEEGGRSTASEMPPSAGEPLPGGSRARGACVGGDGDDVDGAPPPVAGEPDAPVRSGDPAAAACCSPQSVVLWPGKGSP